LQYFQDLLTQKEDTFVNQQTNNNYTEPILEEELNSVLKRIKNHKTHGEDGLNGDIFKYAGKRFNNLFFQLSNNICNNIIPPKSWQKEVVVPLHKKGDIQNHENYRVVELL
jgi:hypothetical protein